MKSLLLQPNGGQSNLVPSCKNLCCNKLLFTLRVPIYNILVASSACRFTVDCRLYFCSDLPSANNVLKGSQKYLDWVGLVSDRNEVTTLIHDHVVIMIVAGFHGFVTRFCAGREIGFLSECLQKENDERRTELLDRDQLLREMSENILGEPDT